MSAALGYYTRRRRKLRRQGLCTRCGTEPARPGRLTCEVCASVMRMKDELRRNAEERRAERDQKKLALLVDARGAIERRIARLSA